MTHQPNPTDEELAPWLEAAWVEHETILLERINAAIDRAMNVRGLDTEERARIQKQYDFAWRIRSDSYDYPVLSPQWAWLAELIIV